LSWHSVHHGDDVERRKWQNPEAILSKIGLKQGQTFIDVGCGDGFFAIPAARMVGVKGRVYAVDIDSDAIACLKQKAEKEGLTQITLQVGEAERVIFCEDCADFVFFGIVLHDFYDSSKVLVNARKMLKSSGCLVNVDWKKQQAKLGPPANIRLTQQEAAGLIEKAGFIVDCIEESGKEHYMVMAHKPK
jgi:ubiquinone/menaquinone biosynthesis C-methylase UbiE